MVRIKWKSDGVPHLPRAKRRCSRRLRIKLHIHEFQRLGFAYVLERESRPSPRAQERFVDHLLRDVVAPRGLSLGGGVDGGFVAARSGSPAEADRIAFETWLKSCPGVRSGKVGPLQDAWYHQSAPAG